MSNREQAPGLFWDVGTAYDMFMSLDVLHHPEEFGLRGAWAAGVRSRLPGPERELLQQSHRMFYKGPFHWVYHLPHPKDGATALQMLEQTPAPDRIRNLVLYPGMPPDVRDILERVAACQSWTDQELKIVRNSYKHANVSKKDVADFLGVWSQANQLGAPYLKALQAYYQVFFAEEELRIQPALHAAVARAKKLAHQMAVPALLEELSEGFRFAEALQVSELVLVPSFWITPLVAYMQVTDERMVFLFGGRPANASLVPGEVIPDALFRVLKALADPTRLRILRYLTAEPLTPAQLSRRLRLRAPTVVHHLRTLRLAGLVHLTLEAGKKVHYTARPEAVTAMFVGLKDFLEEDLRQGMDEES